MGRKGENSKNVKFAIQASDASEDEESQDDHGKKLVKVQALESN